MEPRGRIVFWVVVGVAAVLLFLRSGSVPLIDAGEARYARTSLEMLRGGDIVVPVFEGVPRLVKPPLLHWIQATLFRWLGAHELAARLPAALATLGMVLLTGWVARRRFGEEGAAWTAVFLCSMPLVVALGKVGLADALLSVHVLAVLALDMAEPGETGPHRAAAIGALLGLAFLAKGPVGVVLPLVVMLAGRTAAGREVVPRWGHALTAVVAWCVVVLPWGLVFVERVGLAEVAAVLRTEVLERYFADVSHPQPPWYYAGVVLVGYLPWAAPLTVGLFRVLGRRRDPAARTALYAAAGMLAGLLFFSLGRGKQPQYILPLAPLAAVLITWELGQELTAPRERRLGPGLLAATLVSLAVIFAAASRRDLEVQAGWVALAGAVAYGLAALAALAGVLRRRPRLVYGAAAAASIVFLFAAALGLYPLVGRLRSAAPVIKAVPELSSDRSVVLVELRAPSFTFYLDRVTEKLNMPDLEARLARDDAPLLVLDQRDLGDLPPTVAPVLREVGRFGKYRVYEERGPDPQRDRWPGPAPPSEH